MLPCLRRPTRPFVSGFGQVNLLQEGFCLSLLEGAPRILGGRQPETGQTPVAGIANGQHLKCSLEATVVLPTCPTGLPAKRSLFAVAHRDDPARSCPGLDKVLFNDTTSTRARRQTVGSRSPLVAMHLDVKPRPLLSSDEPGDLSKHGSRFADE